MINIKRFIFILYLIILLSICSFQLFFPIYQAKEIIINTGLHPSDICYDNPLLWKYLKISFIFFYLFSNVIIINLFISRLHIFEKSQIENQHPHSQNSNLELLIGEDFKNSQKIYIFN